MEYKSIKEKRRCFQEAYHITQIEFGSMDDESVENINEYIMGKKELEETKSIELYSLSKIQDDSTGNYSALAALNIIQLDEISEIEPDLLAYIFFHKSIFAGLDAAGELRSDDRSQKLDYLNNRKLSSPHYEKINDILARKMDQLHQLEEYKQIDNTLRDVFKKLNITKREPEMTRKCALLARLTGELFYANPFTVGSITLAIYFIVRFSEVNGFAINRAVLAKEHQSSDLRKSLLLASLEKNYDINFLATIYLYAITKTDGEKECFVENRNRESVSVKIEKVKNELEFNKQEL